LRQIFGPAREARWPWLLSLRVRPQDENALCRTDLHCIRDRVLDSERGDTCDRGAKFGGSIYDLIAISLLPVVAAVVILEVIDRLRIGGCRRGIIAVWMLCGIWFVGPFMMAVGASFSGGGFARPDGWRIFTLAIPLFVHLRG
jgi:hypothetical protein